MPRRRAKLSRALIVGPPRTIGITNAQWSRIEAAYKYDLSAALRKELLESTNLYLTFVPVEFAAETVEAASGKVKRAQKAGLEFMGAVNGLNEPKGDGIVANFVYRRFGRTERLNLFFEMMQSFIGACGIALQEINDPSNHGAINESSWRCWIVDLTKIVESHGLPWQVRKDSDKSQGRASPFVSLVYELQCCIPHPYQPRRRAGDALATAINRARSSGQ